MTTHGSGALGHRESASVVHSLGWWISSGACSVSVHRCGPGAGGRLDPPEAALAGAARVDVSYWAGQSELPDYPVRRARVGSAVSSVDDWATPPRARVGRCAS